MSRHETFSAAGDGRAHAPAQNRRRSVAFRLIAAAPAGWRRFRLWSELVVLFVGIPLLIAAYFESILDWGALGAFSLVAILVVMATVAAVLLAITPGFSFRRLLKGPVLREWKLILGCSALVAAVCSAAVLILLPQNFLDLPLYDKAVWFVVLGAYPLLSALPQELIYRVLFFERYGALFPGTLAAVAANGAAFGFGHLLYMQSITIALTASWGALIAWAYLTRGRSVLLTWVLHSISGWLIFTSGLGTYFHSGAVAATP